MRYDILTVDEASYILESRLDLDKDGTIIKLPMLNEAHAKAIAKRFVKHPRAGILINKNIVYVHVGRFERGGVIM